MPAGVWDRFDLLRAPHKNYEGVWATRFASPLRLIMILRILRPRWCSCNVIKRGVSVSVVATLLLACYRRSGETLQSMGAGGGYFVVGPVREASTSSSRFVNLAKTQYGNLVVSIPLLDAWPTKARRTGGYSVFHRRTIVVIDADTTSNSAPLSSSVGHRETTRSALCLKLAQQMQIVTLV